MDKQATIKKTIKLMKALGTYDKAFDESITKLADLLKDYEEARETFDQGGRQFYIEHTNTQGATNLAKHPLYTVIEKQRMDIASYCRELGLTPAGLKKLQGDSMEKEPEASKLDEILMRLES